MPTRRPSCPPARSLHWPPPLISSTPAQAAWPDPVILTGHLAPTSLVKYQQALRAYLAFCGTPAQALQATSLARWRTYLAQATTFSPHTINRLLAAVKRLVKEAAAQGYVDAVTAAAFAGVSGVKPQAPAV